MFLHTFNSGAFLLSHEHPENAEHCHWTERGQAASVSISAATGRLRRKFRGSIPKMTLHYPILRAYRWVRAGITWGKYRADLGETLDQAVSRFGACNHIGDITSYYPQYEFDSGDFGISISYEDGRAIRVWQSSEKAIPEEFITECLEIYGLGHGWTQMTTIPDRVAGLFSFGRDQPGRLLERGDGEAWACIGPRGRRLDSRTFHFDVVCGRWARVYPTRYGVWKANDEPKTKQILAGQPANPPESK